MESRPPPSLPLPAPPPLTTEIVKSTFFPRNAGYALQDTSPITVTDDDRDSSSSSSSISPSILVISSVIAFVIIISASIKIILRFKSARRRGEGRTSSGSGSAAAGVFPLPFSSHRRSSSASFSSTSTIETAIDTDEKKKTALIDSLPIFSLSSSLATVSKSSPDCAVCLNPFLPHDELRLLPACRHAFHSSCVDIWLRSTPSCPLCRASITLPAPPILPPAIAAQPPSGGRESSRSGSFRIEIGSVSWRRYPFDVETGNRHPTPAPVPPPPLRTYSIGSEMEYYIDEEMEVEAVMARIPRRTEKEERRPETEGTAVVAAPAPPGEVVAEAAGGGGGSGRSGSWLREYVDRLASSTSSSFSSFRLSGRWSHRYDDGGGRPGARPPWDLEGNGGGEAEDGGIYGLYRWVVGAY